MVFHFGVLFLTIFLAAAGPVGDTSVDAPAESPVLLNIHGQAPNDGWTLMAPEDGDGVDVVGPMHDLGMFEDASVTAIYACHVLSHAAYGTMEFQDAEGAAYGGSRAESKPRVSQLEATLREWHRVLKPGGALFLSVPDMPALAKLYLDESLTFADRFFVMRMLFGGQTGAHDFQRVGMDHELTTMYLNATGFCSMTRRNSFGLYKGDPSELTFKGVPISLNFAATACKPGEAVDVQLPPDHPVHGASGDATEVGGEQQRGAAAATGTSTSAGGESADTVSRA
jgi:predicted SAM-dependent methyltransferase